ncbi:MAG: hypothetical protein Q4A81_04760 [Pasteurellaceae bacterium]|nr:hypothetical protein [Pasteurellaceae bacterium]
MKKVLLSSLLIALSTLSFSTQAAKIHSECASYINLANKCSALIADAKQRKAFRASISDFQAKVKKSNATDEQQIQICKPARQDLAQKCKV